MRPEAPVAREELSTNSIDVPGARSAALGSGDHEPRLPGALIYEYRPQITHIVE
jgi:hypothetical protein